MDNTTMLVAIIAGVVGCFFIGLVVVVILIFRRRKKRKESENKTVNTNTLDSDGPINAFGNIPICTSNNGIYSIGDSTKSDHQFDVWKQERLVQDPFKPSPHVGTVTNRDGFRPVNIYESDFVKPRGRMLPSEQVRNTKGPSPTLGATHVENTPVVNSYRNDNHPATGSADIARYNTKHGVNSAATETQQRGGKSSLVLSPQSYLYYQPRDELHRDIEDINGSQDTLNSVTPSYIYDYNSPVHSSTNQVLNSQQDNQHPRNIDYGFQNNQANVMNKGQDTSKLPAVQSYHSYSNTDNINTRNNSKDLNAIYHLPDVAVASMYGGGRPGDQFTSDMQRNYQTPRHTTTLSNQNWSQMGNDGNEWGLNQQGLQSHSVTVGDKANMNAGHLNGINSDQFQRSNDMGNDYRERFLRTVLDNQNRKLSSNQSEDVLPHGSTTARWQATGNRQQEYNKQVTVETQSQEGHYHVTPLVPPRNPTVPQRPSTIWTSDQIYHGTLRGKIPPQYANVSKLNRPKVSSLFNDKEVGYADINIRQRRPHSFHKAPHRSKSTNQIDRNARISVESDKEISKELVYASTSRHHSDSVFNKYQTMPHRVNKLSPEDVAELYTKPVSKQQRGKPPPPSIHSMTYHKNLDQTIQLQQQQHKAEYPPYALII